MGGSRTPNYEIWQSSELENIARKSREAREYRELRDKRLTQTAWNADSRETSSGESPSQDNVRIQRSRSPTRSRTPRGHAPITQYRNPLPRDPKDTEIMRPWDIDQTIQAHDNPTA